MIRSIARMATLFALASWLGNAPAGATAPSPAPPAETATFEIVVAPATVAPGGTAKVSLRLVPAKGIKINKYPKIKLSVAEQPGLVGAAEGAVGSSEPPPVDAIETNYFTKVDPVTVDIPVAKAAAKGRHDVAARLSYFYCVAASGYCAPARVPVKIPVTIR